jgi:TolA-binding protein
MPLDFQMRGEATIMKWLLVILTSCLPFSVAAVLARQPASLAAYDTAAARSVHLRELGLQRQQISDQMVVLQAQGRNFLPR